MTNFLGYPPTGESAHIAKRRTITKDIVIVLDGSGSVGSCEFKKGQEALKHMIDTLHNPAHNSKHAAVTFSSTAAVNFKFLPYSSAAGEITKILYPRGSTNTQTGLAEAKKLFEDTNSGSLWIIFIFYVFRFSRGSPDYFLIFWSVQTEENSLKTPSSQLFGSEDKFRNHDTVINTDLQRKNKWINKIDRFKSRAKLSRFK